MKIIYTIILSLFICASAAPLYAAQPMAHLAAFEYHGEEFLIHKIINNVPLRACVHISNEDAAYPARAELETRITLALRLWISETANFIRVSGRRGEFKDILPVLKKKPRVTFLQNCDFTPFEDIGIKIPGGGKAAPDIYFIYGKKFVEYIYKRKDAPPHFSLYPKPYIALYPSDEAEDAAVITHEIGHALGLADQYESALGSNDILYSTVQPRAGIMMTTDDKKTAAISCDDADGIITLIDRARGKNRKFESLCGDNIIFDGGKEVLKDSKIREFTDKNGMYTSIKYKPDTKDTFIYENLEGVQHNFKDEETRQNLESMGFDIERYKSKNPESLYLLHMGSYRRMKKDESPYMRAPVGKWSNILTSNDENGIDAGNYQNIVNVFDNEGRHLSSTLKIYENDELVSETPLSFKEDKAPPDAGQKAAEIKKALREKLRETKEITKEIKFPVD